MQPLPHLLLSVAAIFLLSACSPNATPPVFTASGPVKGVLENGVAVYRGIPYAAPPVGDLRWRSPQPVAPWSEPVMATEYGPACWQATDAGDALFLTAMMEGAGMGGFTQWLMTTMFAMFPPPVAEDCLTLNIVAPEIAEKLPVMFWIHGGGHQFGSGGQTYESPSLASQGVVLVTVNYRLGLYGFLAHPELAAEDTHGSTGNYGMLDQIAALQWVQENISAFGGDPDNVTIFGESAGGHSVGQLMASPLSAGLFHKAIAQSGTGFYQFQAVNADYERMSGFEAGRKVAQLAGASGENEIAALRTLSVEELAEVALNPEVSETFHPQIDGYVLPASTAEIFRQGRQLPVPLIVGSNADEGTVLYHFGLTPVDGAPSAQPTSVEQWADLLVAEFGDRAADLSALYSVDSDREVVTAAETLMGDSWFGRHAFYMAQQHSAAGHHAYLYFYKRHPPSDEQTIGATHALELNHVFGGFIPMWPSDARDKELRNQMQGYWARFASSGNPNHDSLPVWPPFNDLTPQEMTFGHTSTRAQPVERVERYRLMQAQFEQRVNAATASTGDAAGR